MRIVLASVPHPEPQKSNEDQKAASARDLLNGPHDRCGNPWHR